MGLDTQDDLSLAYTPGVARPCELIAENVEEAWELTWKGRTVAVVSDGSAVLGLGNIGPEASLPVMEGKAVLFKEFGDVDAVPIVLGTQDTDSIVAAVKAMAPGFGGINLEDISAPRCFEIEERLQDIGIPVLHDDQHGTAIVVMAALRNASRLLGRPLSDMRVVVNGAGAAGRAIVHFLTSEEPTEASLRAGSVAVCDRRGLLAPGNAHNTEIKEEMARRTNPEGAAGSLHEVLRGADVFIGVSEGNLLDENDIKSMAPNSIVLAMSNPTPEVDPAAAHRGGAAIVGTGRSDYPNQVNNVLAFPGLFAGALRARARRFNAAMKLAAIEAIADSVPSLSAETILPSPLDRAVAPRVAEAVAAAAQSSEPTATVGVS